ncbi:MAG: hypothetical protein IBJ09_08135 [Bacteroidia bacterium]|nr:hypothetical protein [Bacteroidia bacterium]
MEREYAGVTGVPELLLLIEPGKDIRYRTERTSTHGDTAVTEWAYGRIRRTPTRAEQFLAADKQEYGPDIRAGFTKFSYYSGDVFIGDTSVRIDPRGAGNYKTVLAGSFIRKLQKRRLAIDISPQYRELQTTERFYRLNGRLLRAEWLDPAGEPYYRVRMVWKEQSLLRIYETKQNGRFEEERSELLSWNEDRSEIRVQIFTGSDVPAEDFRLKLRKNRVRRYDAGNKKWSEETLYYKGPDLFTWITGTLSGKAHYVRYDLQNPAIPLMKRRFLVKGTVYIDSYKFYPFSHTLHSAVSRKNGFFQSEVRYYYYYQ